MRIGIVSETYPPEINGVALTLERWVEGLLAHGHEIDLVLPKRPQGEPPRCHPPATRLLESAGLSMPRYTEVRLGLPAGRRIAAYWREPPPDVVYIATEGPLGGSALRCARRLGVPTVTGFHTRFDHYIGHYGMGWLRPLAARYLHRFHQRSALTLAPTQELVDELTGQGLDNVRLLGRSVDTELFNPVRRDPVLRTSWGVTDNQPVMIYVGRLAAEKNLQLGVRAYQEARRQHSELRYVWVGDGPERAALQQAHPEFIFAGMWRGEELARYYASADLFPFPSLSETFGNVIVEALASGLPVVAFDRGAAHRYLKDQVNGLRIDADAADCFDAQAFISASSQLVSDPALRQRLAQAAPQTVASLSHSALISELESLLQAVIHGAPYHETSNAMVPP